MSELPSRVLVKTTAPSACDWCSGAGAEDRTPGAEAEAARTSNPTRRRRRFIAEILLPAAPGLDGANVEDRWNLIGAHG
jgi:hypothetical protein